MKLPAYIGGGVAVSQLAYRLVAFWLSDPPRDADAAADADALHVDEADVLRAMAELKAKGVLVAEAPE